MCTVSKLAEAFMLVTGKLSLQFWDSLGCFSTDKIIYCSVCFKQSWIPAV